MSSLPTPPRLGPRLPLPPAPRDPANVGAEEDTSLQPGDLLEGRYQIEERIGEGGVGFVYRALQLKLHRRVAVKLLQQEIVNEEPLRPRFQQEALTLAALSHPNIVTLQDYGVIRGRPFLVMELLEGRTLRAILDAEGSLAPTRALGFARQLLLALAYAHELGIVHRDLKPANLIVQALPSYEHLKVLDFGLVKLLPGSYLDVGQRLTRQGFTHGTPAYMSPEHALGREVDGRSDLYAVGVLLFEMLTGVKPFSGEPHDLMRHHLSTPVPRLAHLRPELAGYTELQALVDRAMEKERDARFASATELLAVIDQLLLSGLLADADDEAHEDHASARDERDEEDDVDDDDYASLRPRVRETLESAAAALSGYARASREAWRDKASPQLMRARRELRAVAARLAPTLRGLSDAAWARLRPRIAQAAERISRAALEAKARLESSHGTHPALPAPTESAATEAAADQAPKDAAVELPAARRAASTVIEVGATSPLASVEPASIPAEATPPRAGSDTAEPLMLEPREVGRSSKV